MAALHPTLQDGDASAASADELLSQSDRTRVVRRRLPGVASVILKQGRGVESLRRLRHEATLLKRLSGIDGVPRLIEGDFDPDMLALHDDGGMVLAQLLHGPRLPVDEVLRIALGLTRIVAAVHRAGVIHRDINPANILLVGPGRRPMLIDFNIAAGATEDGPGSVAQPADAAGTLAYMAPEQTGRTGRGVDHRADLYSLGATLYEMAAGAAPFEGDDPLQLIHDQLVRVPERPQGVPAPLADIVMRLLEKESDRRYQSAEGLAYDLAHAMERLARGDAEPFSLGLRDFPARLVSPPRPVGREADVALLHGAFDAALRGTGRAVLVSGPAGVGKTALANELRAAVAARHGWFISGRFDPSRHDLASSAVLQALHSLGRLLLSQPDAEVAALRKRLRVAIGANAGLLAGVLPEFGVLLGVTPETVDGDPVAIGMRLFRSGVELLRTVASPARPVVMVVDDMQWSGPGTIGFLDLLFADHALAGVLVVCTYRDAELDAAHPLTPLLARWPTLRAGPHIALRNLPVPALQALLQQVLRLDAEAALRMAEAVAVRSGGNPFDTMELLNALRLDGTLRLTEQGWDWDATAIRRHVGQGEVVDLLARRVARLPATTRELMQAMACLSGELTPALLQAASGLSAEALGAHVAPALDDGLVVQHESGLLSLRHDRVQQATLAGLDDAARLGLQLGLARRLAQRPAWVDVAAEQYLAVQHDVPTGPECRSAAALMDTAAAKAMLLNHSLAERFLDAAIELTKRVDGDGDSAALQTLRMRHLAALYALGRLDDLDRVYAEIESRCTDPLQVCEAAAMRMTSLASRSRQAEAVELGLGMLRQLTDAMGDTAAFERSPAEAWAAMVAWVDELDLARDLQRPEVTDPHVLAAATLLHRMAPPAYLCGPQVLSKAVFLAQRLWAQHGPVQGLLTVIGQGPAVAVSLYGNYRVAYKMGRHVLNVAEARDDEPYTSQLRNTLPTFAQHWFEPLENGLRTLEQAREGLLVSGSVSTASFTYSASLSLQIDCAPSLDTLITELQAAEALGQRAANSHALATYQAFRQLLRALRGETVSPGSFNDASFDEAAHLAGPAAHPVAGSAYRIARALGAALFGDLPRLVEHAAAAMPLAARQSNYRAVSAHLLQALALAQQLQAGAVDDRAAALAQLDISCDWFAARAQDAPFNFQHMVDWLQAERAWAVGDEWAATRQFDVALREVAHQRRPWHQALMMERSALFHLGRGVERAGQQLMREARQCYEVWGASAKVAEMGRRHAFLRGSGSSAAARDSRRSTSVSAEQIDMLALLRASQALSSETSVQRLRARVSELLQTLTGATSVLLVLPGEGEQPWVVAGEVDAQGAPLTVEAAAAAGQLPLSALRQVQRTREPLLVDDAVLDDRVAGDSYFKSLERCSLLGMPILNQGGLRAVLLMENHQSRGAFSADRLDAVMLIGGQLAVSLDNAMLYDSLERKVAERTDELEQANQRLEQLAITDGLTGLANRRHFNEVLETEWKRALRTGASVGLAMIDIDQFKLYNDHYGHLGGDACLKRVAACLKDGQRVVADLAARYGGEEFVLVLPNTDLAGTHTVAERVRRQVAELMAPHANSLHGVVTISVGITAFVPSEGCTAAQYLEVADAALYQAKHHGRNRVWGHEPEAAR